MLRKLQKYCIRNMSCKESARLCSEALDRRLTLQESMALFLHTHICGGCKFYRKQIVGLRKLINGRKEKLDTIVNTGFRFPPEKASEVQQLINKHLNS